MADLARSAIARASANSSASAEEQLDTLKTALTYLKIWQYA